ncbi:MAG: HigA family addiction module antitoxin [Alphaproteobacteria bacterium]|nr:HigA family addiction module antitoxin [Alphaproteobacteria bacterium]
MAKQPIKVGMKPPHPGAFIESEILEPLGLSVTRAAGILSVRRATLSDLVHEKSALSPEMAMRIELAFGVKAIMLLRIQAWWDEVEVRKRASELGVKRYNPEAV